VLFAVQKRSRVRYKIEKAENTECNVH